MESKIETCNTEKNASYANTVPANSSGRIELAIYKGILRVLGNETRANVATATFDRKGTLQTIKAIHPMTIQSTIAATHPIIIGHI